MVGLSRQIGRCITSSSAYYAINQRTDVRPARDHMLDAALPGHAGPWGLGAELDQKA